MGNTPLGVPSYRVTSFLDHRGLPHVGAIWRTFHLVGSSLTKWAVTVCGCNRSLNLHSLIKQPLLALTLPGLWGWVGAGAQEDCWRETALQRSTAL